MITSKTSFLALIGNPVSHSLSPIMQNAALKYLGLDLIYIAIPCKNKDLKNDFKQLGAICSALAGVVAPSTTTAHLAAAVGTRTIIVHNTRTWSPTINGFDAFLPCIQRIHPPNSSDWQWVFEETRRQIDHWLLAR